MTPTTPKEWDEWWEGFKQRHKLTPELVARVTGDCSRSPHANAMPLPPAGSPPPPPARAREPGDDDPEDP